MCFFGFHNWGKPIVKHYLDNSWSNPGSKSTMLIRVCKRCQKVKQEAHFGVGFLTEEELGLTPTSTQKEGKDIDEK